MIQRAGQMQGDLLGNRLNEVNYSARVLVPFILRALHLASFSSLLFSIIQ